MFIEPKKPNVTMASVSAEVIKPETEQAKEALHKLDFETWLPHAAKVYDINPDIRAYVLVTIPICPSDLPNRNGIGFPLKELVAFQPPPISRMSYKTWKGCPLHYEHKNEIHTDAYGIILDTALKPITGYGKGKLMKVMGLIGVDKTKHPEMARRVLENDINTYSMGALVDSFSCSYCGTEATKHGSCHHLNMKNDIDWREVRGWDNTRHVAFRNAHGIQGIETSLVESPAWTTALSDHVLTRGA